MTVESLEQWARRQCASSVSAVGPRNQPNRRSLQTAAAQKSRDLALKDLYIELEALLDRGAAVRAGAIPLPTRHQPGLRAVTPPPASPPALMPPTLGGQVFFSSSRGPSVLPEGMVERRRPRPR
jgi:hypothetical protein